MISPGQRLQRSRRKGSQLPDAAVYVGRPTMWGNPFMAKRWGHARSVILHAKWLEGRLGMRALEAMGFSIGEIDALNRLHIRVLTNLHRLAGKNLACWCPLSSEWCHATTLIQRAPAYAELEGLAA